MQFDAVITEWRLHSSSKTSVDLTSKREVARIAVTNASDSITQLSFHPYFKPWDDNFGLLYIGLAPTKSLNHLPLYSGAILRVNPNKFGFRSFITPKSNPYRNTPDIHDSLFVIGVQQLNQFIWPKKNSEELLISHNYQSKNTEKAEQLISLSNGGNDFRNSAPEEVLYKNNFLSGNNGLINYRGRQSIALHDKMVFLKNISGNWQLNSLPPLPKDTQYLTELATSTIEWFLPSHFSVNETVLVFTNTDDELLFLAQEKGKIYQLSQQALIAPQHARATEEDLKNHSRTPLLMLVLIGAIGLLVYHNKGQGVSAKALVRSQYARITLTDDKEGIHLFKRHAKTKDKTIVIDQIDSCQVLLGDTELAIIKNGQPELGFSAKIEQKIRTDFKLEQADKMVDDKVRKISICLHEKKKISSLVCLYLRKGNDRITKKTYWVVIDDVIDWCWLIAQHINPNNTELRPKQKVSNTETNADHSHLLKNTTPLHQQAADIRPNSHSDLSTQSEKDVATVENDSNQVAGDKQEATATPIQPQPIELFDKESNNAGLVDAELVSALEKLVHLKQQGFLSDEEFTQTKAKLLNNLIDS